MAVPPPLCINLKFLKQRWHPQPSFCFALRLKPNPPIMAILLCVGAPPIPRCFSHRTQVYLPSSLTASLDAHWDLQPRALGSPVRLQGLGQTPDCRRAKPELAGDGWLPCLWPAELCLPLCFTPWSQFPFSWQRLYISMLGAEGHRLGLMTVAGHHL